MTSVTSLRGIGVDPQVQAAIVKARRDGVITGLTSGVILTLFTGFLFWLTRRR